MRLNHHIRRFLEHVEITKNQSAKTIENYQHYLQRFLDFVGDIEPQKITLDLIQDFRLHLNRLKNKRNQELSIKTQNYHIIALRAFLKFLIKNDVATLAPEKIDLSRTEDRQVEYLTREELQQLFDAVDQENLQGLRDKAILETLYSTGLRVSELVSLNRSQISLERGEFMVTGKGRKNRIVFLSAAAITTIGNYLNVRTDDYEPVFISVGRCRRDPALSPSEKVRLTTVSVERIVRNYARNAGLVKKVTPHTLRHTFATELLINGADIRSVQELLGHASITTTQIYTHISNKKLREVHQKFHR